MWIASSEVRSRPTFRYKRRPKYERWSTSRPQKRSGSKSSVLARVDEVSEMKSRLFISITSSTRASTDDFEPERFCGLEVDHRSYFGRRLYRKVGRLLTSEDAIHIRGRAPN